MRFVIALILLVLAGCDKESEPKGQAQPASTAKAGASDTAEIALESANGMRATLSYKFAGQKAPSAPFADAQGQDVSLADFEGKPLLLNIWATWCAPCKAEMPTLDALSSIYDHQYERALEHGVHFDLGRRLLSQDIAQQNSDEFILATGGTPHWPLELPAELQALGMIADLPTLCAQLPRYTRRQPGTALIWDLDPVEATYAVAEKLATLFDKVVLMTPREHIAADCSLVTRQGVLRRMHQAGVQVLTLSQLRWDDAVEEQASVPYDSVFGGSAGFVEHVALITYATPRAPDTDLLAALQATGRPVHLVGDCLAAGDTLSATAQGYSLGVSI